MDKRPNILMIMTDHQRFDSIGMVQCGREVTPNLNRLVEEGTFFERAYDACPLCVPARTALATGIYPTANGVVYNDWKGATAGTHVPIHRLLKDAGYRVGHVGVNHIRIQPPMAEQGLDYLYDQKDYEEWAASKGLNTARNPRQMINVLEDIDGKYEQRRYSGYETDIWDAPIEQFKDMYFRDRALNFLEGTGQEPFALFVYLWAPHPPLKVPEPYASMYAPDQVTLPGNVGKTALGEPELRRQGVPAQLATASMEQWRKTWAAHLGLTTMADDILGQILNRIREMGEYDDTCVIFTPDHGDHLGQHRMYQKMEMYEEAIHVPLVIRMPGLEPGRTGQVVSHLDIMPTICEIAGIPLGLRDSLADGYSLLPLMKGEKEDQDRIVYCQYSGNPGYGTVRRAAISKRYKYIFDNAYCHELYDLEKDPHEMRNVADEKEYETILKKMYTACGDYHLAHDDYYIWRETDEERS